MAQPSGKTHQHFPVINISRFATKIFKQVQNLSLFTFIVYILGNKSVAFDVRGSQTMEPHVPDVCSTDDDAAPYKDLFKTNSHYGTITVKA